MPFVRNPQVDNWTISDWEQYLYPDPPPPSEELIALRRTMADVLMKNWEDLIAHQKGINANPTA